MGIEYFVNELPLGGVLHCQEFHEHSDRDDRWIFPIIRIRST
jgi:hypothetical protein